MASWRTASPDSGTPRSDGRLWSSRLRAWRKTACHKDRCALASVFNTQRPSRRRRQGSFWPEAGAWPKWSKTKALPGFIFGPKPAPGRSGQKPRRCQGSFWAEAGASPKWSKTETRPGLILARSRRLVEVVQIEALLRLIFGPKPAHAPLGACPGPSMCGGAGACIAPRVRSSLVAIRR